MTVPDKAPIKKRLLIKNVRLIEPKSCYDGIADIVICGTRFERIFKYINPVSMTTSGYTAFIKKSSAEYIKKHPGITVFDASGLCAAPGLIDIHCHFRDPGLTHKEDIITGAMAAKKGGFTTVVLMANTSPPVDNTDTLKYVLEKAEKTNIHVLTCAAVSKGLKGKALTDMEALLKAGAAGFTDDGISLLNEAFARKAFEKCSQLHVPISLHEEDPAYMDGAGINAGLCQNLPKFTPDDLRKGLLGKGGAVSRSEYSLIKRDLRLAHETKAVVNFQHLSTVQSVELIREYLKQNCAKRFVHAEVTPQHFSLTQDSILTKKTLAKVNPPLRTDADRMALIEGLKDGTIDIIASDHAPHTKEEKNKPFFDAPSGMIGLETSLALGITELVDKGHISLLSLIEKMTINPAKLYQIEAGSVAEGGFADMVIFDPAKEWIVDTFVSKSSNSPFIGRSLKGAVVKTICGGEIVYEGGIY